MNDHAMKVFDLPLHAMIPRVLMVHFTEMQVGSPSRGVCCSDKQPIGNPTSRRCAAVKYEEERLGCHILSKRYL